MSLADPSRRKEGRSELLFPKQSNRGGRNANHNNINQRRRKTKVVQSIPNGTPLKVIISLSEINFKGYNLLVLATFIKNMSNFLGNDDILIMLHLGTKLV